jgi:hypothetical protein
VGGWVYSAFWHHKLIQIDLDSLPQYYNKPFLQEILVPFRALENDIRKPGSSTTLSLSQLPCFVVGRAKKYKWIPIHI